MKQTIKILCSVLSIIISFSISVNAREVTLNEVLQLSKNFISTKEIQKAKLLQKTGAHNILNISELIEHTKNEVLAHIVNLQPKGFLVISPDLDIEPIIAYSFNSNWSADTSNLNILYHMVRNDMKLRRKAINELPSQMSALIERNNGIWEEMLYKATNKYENNSFQQWPEEGTTSTGGWIETTWAQLNPYNNFCPLDPNTRQRCPVGCVATAMAQIINYHQYIGQASFNINDKYISNRTNPFINIDTDSTIYDFPSFEKLNSYLTDLRQRYQNRYQLNIENLAALNFACGVSIQMSYSSGASYAYLNRVALALTNKFNYASAQYISAGIYNKLSENNINALPTEIAIRKNYSDPGHAVVCDGYNTNNYYHLNFGLDFNPNYITEAWYSLPDGMPDGYTIVDGAVVDIKPCYGLIKGNVVLNSGTGNVIDLKIKAGNITVHPDVNGNYKLDLNPSTYNITASLYGYESQTIENVLVKLNQITDNIDFVLNPYIFKIIHVDCNGGGDYLTIQEGINAANDYDTVIVHDGTYIENINYNGKNIIIGSLLLTTGDTTYISRTIIDGNQAGTVVTFNNNIDSNAVLNGLTVRNGSANEGGGVCFINSSPKLKNVIIIGNNASNFGGGIYCYNSSPSLNNVAISGNSLLSSNSRGAGVYCSKHSKPNLINVSINGNTCSGSSSIGGGIYCDEASNPILSNVTIKDNSAEYRGGGIYCELSSPTISNTVIKGNIAEYGGGIYLIGSSAIMINSLICDNNAASGAGLYINRGSPKIINSTIMNNSCINIGNVSMDDGGGIWCCYKSNLQIVNSLICGNRAVEGGGLFFTGCFPIITNTTICYNLAKNNGGGIHWEVYNYNFKYSMNINNSVIWGNSAALGYSISISNPKSYDPPSLYFEYSDIDTTKPNWLYLGTSASSPIKFIEGNFSADPLFTSTDSKDYSLRFDSPCIDAGKPDTSGLNIPPIDLNRNIRIWDGNNDNSSIIDLGAYEYGAPESILPRIISLQDTIIIEDLPYNYQLIAKGNPQPHYELSSFPKGMTIDRKTGLISWTPTNENVGKNKVTVIASNYVGSDVQSFIINVQNINDAPVILNFPDSVLFYSDSLFILDLNDYVNDVDNPDSSLQWYIAGNCSVIVSLDQKLNVVKLSAPLDWYGKENLTFTVEDDSMAQDRDTLKVRVLLPSEIADNNLIAIPKEYFLAQNYPNPFNPVTTINYQLPKAGKVNIQAYNIVGQKVLTLVNEYKPAGYYSVLLSSESFASGIYFYKIEVSDYTSIKKLIVLK